MAVGRARAARTVGRYQLVHELGQSYLGPLWAVRIEGADSSAQLAMLRLVSLARLDADTRVRLLEAAWQAMEVRDDRICSVTDVVASDGELGIVSDYVEGVTLRGLSSFASVRRKPAPPSVAVRVALDLLSAVVALHRTTLELGDEAVPLYGGLSADSVLLSADGRTLVLDVAVTSAASTIETLGGNPERAAYAAPEQLRSPASADARTDLFTVGVLFWELLACRRLFVGADKAVAQKVLSSKIPRPDELRRKGDPEMPSALIQTVMKALDRDPGGRPESAEAFAALLTSSGVVPAEREEVALYVTTLAEGALQRARDAVRSPSFGPRAALPKTAAKPTAPPPPEAASAAQANQAPLPRRPESAEGKPPLPGRTEAKTPHPGRTDVKPPLPARAEPKPPEGSGRGDAKPVMRARQPTMIGIPAPSVQIARPPPEPSPPPDPTASDSAAAVPAGTPEEAVRRLEASAPVSIPIADLSDEEPTAQFTSRDLLRQVEAMGMRSEPARNAPTEFPKPEAPDSLVISPKPEGQSALSDLVSLDAPGDGGWLDDPASLPPPPLDRDAVTPDDPRETAPVGEPPATVALESDRAPSPLPNFAPAPVPVFAPTRAPDVAPSPAAHAARELQRPLTSKAPVARGLSVAPPATTTLSMAPSAPYLPSQVPPPLIHDPRARSGSGRKAPAAPEPPAPRVSRGMAIGVALSLSLVIVSAAVAILVLRGQREDEPESPGQPHATDRGQTTPQAAGPSQAETPVPATAPSAPEPEASASPPAASAETALAAQAEPGAAPSSEGAGTFPVTPPGAHPFKPSTFGARSAPAAPRRAPAPKKKGRYVPDDI